MQWWADLKLALQFFLDPFSDVGEGDLPLPEHRTHVKVQPGRNPETVPVIGKKKEKNEILDISSA